MDAAYCFPIFNVGEKHARADHVGERDPGFGQGFFGDDKNAAGLSGCVCLSAPTGPVPARCTTLPTRTAREKPMMGSKGDPPLMLLRGLQ